MFDSVLPKKTAASEGAESTEGHGALREIRKLREIRGCGFLFLFLPGLVLAQAGRPLAIEDYYRVKTVSAPAMSPDGRWVAFTVSTRTEATNADSAEVWLVPADGSAAARRVSPPGKNASNPRWSADGRLTYQSQYLMSLRPEQPDSQSSTIWTEARPGMARSSPFEEPLAS